MTQIQTPIDDSLAAVLERSPDREKIIDGMSDEAAKALFSSWEFLARKSQLVFDDLDYNVILFLGGRGAGKTRAILEALVSRILTGKHKRLAAVAKSKRACRETLVEGVSGLLNLPSTQNLNVKWSPSKREVKFPDFDATISLLSADEPSQAAGPAYSVIAADELSSWMPSKRRIMWDNLEMACRIPPHPLLLAATTPSPIQLLFDLTTDKRVRVVTDSTYANSRNLSPRYLQRITEKYANTRLGQEQLYGQLLQECEGALFKRSNLVDNILKQAPALKETVIGLDPSGAKKGDRDSAGIIPMGVDAAGHLYILADLSGQYSPSEWATKAIKAYRDYQASKIIYESNYGGAIIESVIHGIDSSVICEASTAKGKKSDRAQQLIMLSEQEKVHCVGNLEMLVDEFCSYVEKCGWSPGRLDATVHAANYLLKRSRPVPAISPPVQDFLKVSNWRTYSTDGNRWSRNTKFYGD